MRLVTRKLSDLVFDKSIFPRAAVDEAHVEMMREAERAGKTFPPYVIDAKSLRVIDGFHRGRKDLLEHGGDHLVKCDARDFPNDGAMLVEAIRLNASHGRPLSKWDRASALAKCKGHKVAMKAAAAVLGMSLATVTAIANGRVAHVAHRGGSVERVTIKRTIGHMAGQTLTEEQRSANDRLSGSEQETYVEQLLILVKARLVNMQNVALMAKLAELHSELGAMFAEYPVGAAN